MGQRIALRDVVDCSSSGRANFRRQPERRTIHEPSYLTTQTGSFDQAPGCFYRIGFPSQRASRLVQTVILTSGNSNTLRSTLNTRAGDCDLGRVRVIP